MAFPKNKYRKGFTIYEVDTLRVHLERGRWVYLKNKVVHPSFILHMTLDTIVGYINARLICEAIDQQKEYYANL